jgi:homocysteine S-methyltransferase
MLYAKGVFINQCYDELNVRAPDLVRDVHRAYVKAGAEVLETNSFGANRVKLSQFGLAEQVHELNRRAAELAREAAEGGRRAGRRRRRPARYSHRAVRSDVERGGARRFREQLEGLKAAAPTASSSRPSATSRSSARRSPRHATSIRRCR